MNIREFLAEVKKQQPTGWLDLELQMPDGLSINYAYVSMDTVILSDAEEEVQPVHEHNPA